MFMGMNNYSKSMIVNLIFSAVFIIAGLYLAMNYFMEFPDPQLHWNGIIPLVICLFFYFFSWLYDAIPVMLQTL